MVLLFTPLLLVPYGLTYFPSIKSCRKERIQGEPSDQIDVRGRLSEYNVSRQGRGISHCALCQVMPANDNSAWHCQGSLQKVGKYTQWLATKEIPGHKLHAG